MSGIQLSDRRDWSSAVSIRTTDSKRQARREQKHLVASRGDALCMPSLLSSHEPSDVADLSTRTYVEACDWNRCHGREGVVGCQVKTPVVAKSCNVREDTDSERSSREDVLEKRGQGRHECMNR